MVRGHFVEFSISFTQSNPTSLPLPAIIVKIHSGDCRDPRIKSQIDLAQMIGRDKTWVSGMPRILSLLTELQRKVTSTQLSIAYGASGTDLEP
jgi:hypothetical protein